MWYVSCEAQSSTRSVTMSAQRHRSSTVVLRSRSTSQLTHAIPLRWESLIELMYRVWETVVPVALYNVSTQWAIKTCHVVFDYNSGFSWSIFNTFCTSETGSYRLLYKEVNKMYHFTLTLSPRYLVKLKRQAANFEVNHHSAFDWTD